MFPADDLDLCGQEVDPWDDIANGVVGPARALRTLLTYERLRQPPGPIGGSYGTARARLYPFQFKPLIKFLNNPNHTLLIADEVGLGKTIEAGYILREWKQRQAVDTVLVVVPARLRTKWKQELAKRFDERFEIVAAREVRAMLRGLGRGREMEPFQWIASYESLRLPDIVERFGDLSPPLDFLILDEAHRVRNTETLQHRLARALGDCAHAMLYLTATPVQTSLDNLHTLLNLLQPGAFGSARDFLDLVDANRPVIRASSLAAAGEFELAAGRLLELRRSPLTAGLVDAPIVQQMLKELNTQTQPSRRQRVYMQSAISDLSLTGHMVTRTRKTEVFENRARRKAWPRRVQLSADELEIYNVVADVTRLLHPDAGSWGRSMAALTAYRYTASCIPAAIGYMRSRLSERGFEVDVGDLSDEVELDVLEEELEGQEPWQIRSRAVVDRVRQALRLCPPPAQDSKLQELLKALDLIHANDRETGRPLRKIIIFSFFKRTLAYLEEQLNQAGFSNTIIHGDIPILDREERIERFLADARILILLSSEVGGEGLDLQRASVVVNYDLPWNPMVVEQRIGRVDRIGQESDTITILNMVCCETVEERILHRLYDRVELFENSVGEMEEILGAREVRDLVVAMLRGELSDKELADRVEQTARAAEMRRKNAEDLSRQVDGLMAADQAILDQVRMLIDGHRLPSERDIADLVHGFLNTSFPGVQMRGDPCSGLAELDVPGEARARLQQWSEANMGAGRRLVGALRRGPIAYTVSADTAMSTGRAEFLQARHPLVQFAVEEMSRRLTDRGAAFGVRVKSPDISVGHWLAGIWSVTVEGAEGQTELHCGAARIGDQGAVVGEQAEPLLTQLLAGTEELDPRPELDPDEVEQAVEKVQAVFLNHVLRLRKEGQALAERRFARRRTTVEATLRQQVRRAEAHVAAMVGKNADPLAIRFARAKLAKRNAELERRLQDFENTPSYRLVPTDVATVLVEVTRE